MDTKTHDQPTTEHHLDESLINRRFSGLSNLSEQIFSIDDIITKIGFGKYQLKAFFFLGMIAINDGTEAVLLSILQNVLANEWGLPPASSDIISTCIFVGFFFGAIASGKISDRYGRKTPIIYLGLLTYILGVASAFAGSFVTLAVLRAIYGFLVGTQIPICYSHLTEIIPRVIRGRVLVLAGSTYIMGELLPCIISYFTLNGISSGNWRLLLILSATPALIGWIGITFMLYESPRYIIATKKDLKQGIEVLKKMAAQNKVEINIGPEEEHNLEIWVSFHDNLKSSQVASWRSLFKGRAKLITLYLWPVWFILSLSYYSMVYILPRIIEALEIGTANAKSYELWNITFPILGEIPALFLAVIVVERDHFGRRASITAGIILAAIFCILAGWAPYFIIWVVGARMSLNAVFIITTPYTSELYPTIIRATGLGLANSFSRLAGALMPWVSHSLLEIGPRMPYYGFAIFCLLGAFCCYRIVYDTTKRELDFEYTVTKDGKSPTHEPQRRLSALL